MPLIGKTSSCTAIKHQISRCVMIPKKGENYTKSTLEKALKSRLAALTHGLAEAEVGGKGIDLVKEIKELHSMIAALKPESKTKKEDTKLVVVWGPPPDDTKPSLKQEQDNSD